jgi:Fe2+ or Zn2+ uptake regulation protein
MCHHTAEEILALARERMPGISRATVYNNLKALEEDGFIRRLACDGTVSRYDKSHIPHGHLFCTECGEIYDFTIPDFERVLSDTTEAVVDSYELRLHGVCPACKSKQ